jgi:hypothetical protein
VRWLRWTRSAAAGLYTFTLQYWYCRYGQRELAICGRSAIAIAVRTAGEHLSSEQCACSKQFHAALRPRRFRLQSTVKVVQNFGVAWTRRDGSRRCDHRRRMSDVISV